MAVGDDASAAGYPLVPNTGEEGRVRWGAREINRTRDFVAQVARLIPAVWPITKGGTGGATAKDARLNLGISGAITMGTDNPTGGENGDIYFKYVV
jgi:hypothetical protein